MSGSRRYLALCGGVGGAKLAQGLAQVLAPEELTIAVNVGDDFTHLGLPICPDLDTVLYTLAGLAHAEQGWGRGDESWAVHAELGRLGGPDWFALGDRDIALHLRRRQLLDEGLSLSAVMRELAARLGVAHAIVPISDAPVRTCVVTDVGRLAFQDYFVARRAEPVVRAVEFDGAAQTEMAPGVQAALADPDLAGVILCPSNPYLSIAPMLAVPGLRPALTACEVPVIAVSPIVGGQAIKGPAAKIMRELGVEPQANVIAELYRDFVDRVLVDTRDAALVAKDARCLVAPTVMRTAADRQVLAAACLSLIEQLSGCAPPGP